MLKIDFYESGKGETIVIGFPDGGIGIVDAHPSPKGLRPKIEDIVQGRSIHFLCLTHPHSDHGLDLPGAMTASVQTKRFWHTVTDIQVLLYAVTEEQQFFPNRNTPLLTNLRTKWANFLIDLYSMVDARTAIDPAFTCKLNAERKSEEIAGVKIHFFGPLESSQNKFTLAYKALIKSTHRVKPDENSLSAILGIEYGGRMIILGADALAENWKEVVERCRKEGLPKATILKVPHHGASNALGHPAAKNYTDLCLPGGGTIGVLFGGDSNHPNEKVFDKLKSKMTLQCLANGRKPPGQANSNPLNLKIPGAYALASAPACNPHLSFQIDATGQIQQVAGNTCAFCQA